MTAYNLAVDFDTNTLKINFNSETLCSAVGRLEFCSRLLYKLKPNEQAVWVETSTPRVSAHVVGFPPELVWERPSAIQLVAKSENKLTQSVLDSLHKALTGIHGSQSSAFTATEYNFSIYHQEEKKSYDYRFDGRSRAIVSFCVLWDCDNHPRDHLEVWRHPNLKFLAEWEQSKAFSDKPIKTYGDPSKTVDELRNQGFPRDTDQSPRGMSLDITRATRYNTVQEHYRLVKRDQSMADRVGRSQIPKRYKMELYLSSGYCCNNCGQQYDFDYLAPDHRVPSIVQSDNLTAENFNSVLQTLCVRCNQVKREACKKCPYDHRCENCAWAYPEQHGVSKNSLELLKKAADLKRLSINDLIKATFS